MAIINVYSDGGARGNPGPAGAGFVVFQEDKELVRGKKYLGKKTNNQAEYLALIEALLWLNKNNEKINISEVRFYLDSELVVKQVQGKYKVKNQGLKHLYDNVLRLLSELKSKYVLFAIPREKNIIADSLVNEALDQPNEN